MSVWLFGIKFMVSTSFNLFSGTLENQMQQTYRKRKSNKMQILMNLFKLRVPFPALLGFIHHSVLAGWWNVIMLFFSACQSEPSLITSSLGLLLNR